MATEPKSILQSERRETDPYESGKIAWAVITTDSNGVVVDFATDFANRDGSIDLSSVTLASLTISNTKNSDSITYNLDGIGGEIPVYRTIPGRNALKLFGFSTEVVLVLKDGDAIDAEVEIEAIYEIK